MTAPSSDAVGGLVERIVDDIKRMPDGERQFWAERITPLLAALEAQARELAELRAVSAADEYIDQLNALCEEFGCEPGSDRLRWLRERLVAADERGTEPTPQDDRPGGFDGPTGAD